MDNGRVRHRDLNAWAKRAYEHGIFWGVLACGEVVGKVLNFIWWHIGSCVEIWGTVASMLLEGNNLSNEPAPTKKHIMCYNFLDGPNIYSPAVWEHKPSPRSRRDIRIDSIITASLPSSLNTPGPWEIATTIFLITQHMWGSSQANEHFQRWRDDHNANTSTLKYIVSYCIRCGFVCFVVVS